MCKEELQVPELDFLCIKCIVVQNELMKAQASKKGNKMGKTREVRDTRALFVLAGVDGVDEALQILFEFVFHNNERKCATGKATTNVSL